MQARIAKKRKKKTFVKAIFSLNWEVASGDHIHGGLRLRLYLNQFKGLRKEPSKWGWIAE